MPLSKPPIVARSTTLHRVSILSETDLLQALNHLALPTKNWEDLPDAKKRLRIRIPLPIYEPDHYGPIPSNLT